MPNDYKIYHMAVKYIKWPKIFQQNPLQDLQKFTQIGIFGFKIYHLATLIGLSKVEASNHARVIGRAVSFFHSITRRKTVIMESYVLSTRNA
jgi:hypothetical protein